MGVRPDRVLAGAAWSDRDHRAPLREPGAELVVLRQALTQAVEPFGHRLLGRTCQRLRAHVDLDPGDDPLLLEQLRERRAVRRALPDRLVVKDDAADELLRTLGREEEIAVGA